MDSQKSHRMPEEENARLSSQERKIYPLTGDLIEEADQYLVERLRQRRLKREAQKAPNSETAPAQGEIPHLD